ncbi:ROK family protein [Virgibacillus halodenitrificans]|uniref:ROK family protein n=1 Tax=Virgibacillus halodenitrificans TaxID=1482 RepID=UPI00136A7070|nr:ROK family protein [Virgibacillus halodenitrificans]MYL47381.1 ROK family protein [Virgibacillus halodenitrificans]
MNVIGIDIGGTKIKFGLFDEEHQLSRHTEIPTPKKNIIGTMIETIATLTLGKEIRGIGVASAGIVDFSKGMITRATNLPDLEHAPLSNRLKDRFHVPVYVDNDANCAALTEGIVGAAKEVNHYICATIGTGIGGGVVQHKQIIHGLNGYSGEVGHMTLYPDGMRCDCGKKGCWERYASGRALEDAIHSQPSLSAKDYTPKDLFVHYPHDEQCKQIIDTFIHHLSIGIINLQYTLDPEMIVLGGGVVNATGPWWDSLIKEVNTASPIKVNLQRAQWKNDASMIGAALLVKNAREETLEV